MAWQRAKGELKSMLDTFYPEYTAKGQEVESNFAELQEVINKFIKEVEDNGLHD